MSRTKRWIEELQEKGEYPPPMEIKLIKTKMGPPYEAHCPSCGHNYKSSVPIPDDAICQGCYMADLVANYQE
jgi:hypothetical protein